MRTKDAIHLKLIRYLPCIVCGDNTSVEAAHIRMADGRIGKPATGLGIKPDDKYTVPLCGKHHREQHAMKERTFWDMHRLDPILLSLFLYSCDTVEEGEDLIRWLNTRFIPMESSHGL